MAKPSSVLVKVKNERAWRDQPLVGRTPNERIIR
jgi:hypothetical protein